MKTIHLVLVYSGTVFVDSAWSTAEAAEARAEVIADNRKAFRTYLLQDEIKTLAIQVDGGGVSVQFQIPSDWMARGKE